MEVVWVMLALLPLCSGHSEYQGTVMTYYPLQTHQDGSVTVEVRYKSNSRSCAGNGYQEPPEGYHGVSQVSVTINNSPGGFCQIENIWIRRGPTNAPILMQLFSGSYLWSGPTANGVSRAQSSTLIELRRRSDTGQTNRSPQTTVLPVYRVPHNCKRELRLPNVDPDGDLVRCRFADNSIDQTECLECTPPSVLSLTPPCTLSFSGTDSSAQGLYAVQMVMEDFPRTVINLTLSNGAEEQRSTTDAISKVALQFLFSVESSAPSCVPGLDLPRFVEPTPEHGAQIRADVGQTLEIRIEAETRENRVLELVFSGPSRITKTDVDDQTFTLSWSPVETEDGQSHPVCFSAQTSTSKFSSEFRCVIVNVGFDSEEVVRKYKVFQRIWMSSSAPLTDEAVKASLLQQIKLELEKAGQPHVSISLGNRTL